jgi:hypothetical protein
MSARFKNDGSIKVEAGIKKVFVKLTIKWNDATTAGFALVKAFMDQENKEFNWERSYGNEVGSAERNFQLFSKPNSGKDWSISYIKAVFESGTLVEKSTSPSGRSGNKEIYFYDSDGNDKNVIITMKTSNVEYFPTPPSEPVKPGGPGIITNIDNGPIPCPPGPWSQTVPPSCGTPPNGTNSSGGLQITKTGQNQITLNLANYANKLVTLKITHQTSASWTQSFSFNVPNCSDISPNTGGTPYSKSGYSNSNISGTNTFYVYNIDGGNYNYVFNHGSVPGPAPQRQLFTVQSSLSCTEPDEDGNQTCTRTYFCVPAGIEYFSPWPYCATGVAISKNGGDKVQWQYEDGGGGNYDDQYVTVEVISVRNAISATGPVCTSALKANVWVPDSTQVGAAGNCIGDYRDHSDKIRFRIPSLKSSKTSLPDPVCYSNFRGIAGAVAPGTDLGSLSSEYSVLHIFDRDVNQNVSLVSDTDLVVTANNLSDTYVSPYDEADPSANANLGTTGRKYYSVTFNDGTIVQPSASNINVFVGQDVTADGINTPITVFKKTQINTNTVGVWFYISHVDVVQFTDDVLHVFDDTTDTTDTELSDLSSPQITVTPKNLTDPGNQTPGYENLDDLGKKYYEIEFLDETIVDATASNINITVNRNLTASNVSTRVQVSKISRVDNKTIWVWFRAYYGDRPAGEEWDNCFVRDWSIDRSKDVNYSGNTFARNWYLEKTD